MSTTGKEELTNDTTASDESVVKPHWWPKNPYPEAVFPVTEEQFVEFMPDPRSRSAVSGFLGRLFWGIAEATIWDHIAAREEDQQVEWVQRQDLHEEGEIYLAWSLLVHLPSGRKREVASVYSNGIWHTWDQDGVGGENASEGTVARAKSEATYSAVRQGFI